MNRPSVPARPDGVLSVHLGSDYTPAEIEFLLAMERYKREKRRPYPTCCEILAVLVALGYRKEPPP